jgi:HSP20 family molecular chaperone IbpA
VTNHRTITKATGGDGATRGETTRGEQFYRPNCDILEEENELLVLADVPGAKGPEIDIRFEDGALTIHAPVRDRQAEDQAYVLREYGVGDFYRTFQVSESIDAAKISADYNDGVLTLHLPKAEALKPRKISVKAK